MAMDRVKQKKYKTTDKDEEIHKPNGNRQLKRNEKNKRFMRSFFFFSFVVQCERYIRAIDVKTSTLNKRMNSYYWTKNVYEAVWQTELEKS